MADRSFPPVWPFTRLEPSAGAQSLPDLQQEELRWNFLKAKRGLPFDPHLIDLAENINTHKNRVREAWGREAVSRTGPRLALAVSDRKLHTRHEDLKPEEILAFERMEFVRFQVPTRPPSKELCKEPSSRMPMY